jgi:hypothetical protein
MCIYMLNGDTGKRIIQRVMQVRCVVSVVNIVIGCLYLPLLPHEHLALPHVSRVPRCGVTHLFMGRFDSESRWDNIVIGY